MSISMTALRSRLPPSAPALRLAAAPSAGAKPARPEATVLDGPAAR